MKDQNEQIGVLIDMIKDMFNQACRRDIVGTDGADLGFKYDHMFISVYEEAQTFLIEEGRIKPEDCYFY